MDGRIGDRRGSRRFVAPAAALSIGLHLLLATPQAFAKVEPEESRAYYESALEHIEQDNLRAAVIELKNALQRNPQNAEARLRLGQVYLRLGNGAAAEKELNAARRYGIASERTAVPRGRALLLLRRFETLLAEFDPADYGPAQALEIELLRAEANAGLDRLAASRRGYERIARSHPEEARAHLGLARLDLETRQLEAAEAQADAALAKDPALVDAMLVKAEALRLQGEAQSSLSFYRKVVDDRLASLEMGVRARLGLATALIALQRDDEAETALAEAQSVASEVPLAVYLRALIKVRARDFEAARRILDDAAPSLEGFGPAQFLLGVTYFAADELETARTWLSRHLSAQPENLQARKLLSAALLRLNAVPEAVDVLEAGLSQAPDDPQVLMMLGSAYLRSGRPVEANELLQRAAEKAPQDPRVLGRLAVSHLATGAYDESLATLSSTLQIDPEASALGYALAFAHLRAGAFSEALKVAQELRRRFPKSAVAANLEGAAYAALAQLEEAQASFEAALVIEPGLHQARSNLASLRAQAGDISGAEAEYLTILETDSGHAKAMMGLSAVAGRRGDQAKSREWLKKAVEANPEDPQPSIALAESYAGNSEFGSAEEVLSALVRRQPENAQALSALGHLQARDNRNQEAVETFRRLVGASGGNVEARLLLARARLAAGDPRGARRELEDALAAEPGHPAVGKALFQLLAQQESPEAMLSYAQRLQRRYPEASWSDKVVGDLHLRAGRREAALAAYEDGWQKRQSAELAIALAQARLGQAAAPSALAPLQDWLAQHPDDDRVRLVLAESRLGLGDLEGARIDYEVMRERQAKNPVVWNNLAWLYQQQGDERAVAAGERALELAPSQPAIMDTLGWVLLEEGDTGRAADLLRQANQAAPGSLDIAYHYAVALHKTGDDTAARKVLEGLLQSERAFADRSEAAALLNSLSQ